MKLFKVLLMMLFIVIFALISVFVLFAFINKTNGKIESSGKTRRYLLYVPDSYQVGKPTPLVVSLHGFASWPAHQQATTNFNALADAHGFIVVYPGGTGFPLRWQTGKYGNKEPFVDVIFITDLIDLLMENYSIDPDRIYVNGFSNGGGMAYFLACSVADRITAIGTVAGAYALDPEECKPTRPVPVITFHGTDDQIVPYEGGDVSPPGYSLPVIDDWVLMWAKRDGCNQDPVDLIQHEQVRGIKYTGCQAEVEVQFYTIEGGGHSWPGGQPMPEMIVGKTSDSIDATELMWTFFSKYELDTE